MRIPATPPDWRSYMMEHLETFAQDVASPSTAVATVVADAHEGYWHWDKLRFRAKAANVDPDHVWALVRFQRVSQQKALPLRSDKHAPLTFWLPDSAQRELMLIDQQLAGVIGQPTRLLADKRQTHAFIANSLMEEAIASSLLEGAATTRREAKRMLREQRRPRTTGEWMVANNFRAIEFVRQRLDADLTLDLLLELHQILAADTMPDDWVGRLRRGDDVVEVVDGRDGAVMHVPLPADELQARLVDLFAFANDTVGPQVFVHPVVRAIATHFQLAYEHPFCDGNGRVARALFYWSMLRQGYWLFEFLPLSRLFHRAPARYARAFLYTETDDFDFGYFLSYHLQIIATARRELREHLDAAARERAAALETFSGDDRLNPRQTLLLQELQSTPDSVVTIASHRAKQRVAYATAREDLRALERWNYLASSKRGRAIVYRLRAGA